MHKAKLTLLLTLLAALGAQTSAFEIDAGDDWAIRWDNQLKGNLATRVAAGDDDVRASLLAEDPSRSFGRSKGGLISARVDWISEADFVWREQLGFRISGAGWYDAAYEGNMEQPDSIAAHWPNPSVRVGELSDEAEDLHYLGGELLDAFIFASFDVGNIGATIRAGRHTIFWGQSLLLTGSIHSVGGSMNTIDALKGFSVPGSEAKELFRPNNKISTEVQLTGALTVSGYYSLEWEAYRLARATTFFSAADGLTQDTEVVHLAAPDLDGDGVPDIGIGLDLNKNEHPTGGEWGVNFTYYFDGPGLEVQLYYLNYHYKVTDGVLGVINADQALAAGIFDAQLAEGGADAAQIAGLKAGFGAAPTPIDAQQGQQVSVGRAKWAYKEDIDLIGLSFSKQIGDISVGVDLTYRAEAPLRLSLANALQRFTNIPAPLAPQLGDEVDFDAVDESSYNDFFTTGDTYHVVINALGLLNDNGIWEGGNYIIEATFSMLDQITSREDLINKTDAINVAEDRITTHLAVNFNPQWFQVRPGLDVTLQSSIGIGIDGNSPMSFGGDEESGSGGLGVLMDFNQTWSATLKYNFFFGPVPNAVGNFLKDRDNVSLTFKRTF